MTVFSDILARLGLLTEGPPDTLNQTINVLVTDGADFSGIVQILAAMQPTAPQSPILSGQQDFPSPVSISPVTPESTPEFGQALDPIVSLLLAANADYSAIVDLLSRLSPTAQPSLMLPGDQDFPAGVPTSSPTSDSSPNFGPALDPIVSSLLAANADYSAIVDLLSCFGPTAPPSLTLTGDQDFPAVDSRIDRPT